MERKLAAIMAGDIVGYSRLMAENEVTTYAELRSVFDDLIEPTVGRFGGRMFKRSGDGFLAAFASVNDALDAAVEIQNGFDQQRFEFRIGVNLGDVIADNGDVYGDGVNVALLHGSKLRRTSVLMSLLCSRYFHADGPRACA